MLSARLRRVWLRRLRRRPLLPFLLAATAAVDLVILSSRGNSQSPYASGLIAGQIALLGAWVTWAPRGISSRVCVLMGLALIAGPLINAAVIPAEVQIASPEQAQILRALSSATVLVSLIATTLGGAAVRLAQRLLRGKKLGPSWRLRITVGFLLRIITLIAFAYTLTDTTLGEAIDWQVISRKALLIIALIVFGMIFAEAVITALVLGLSSLPLSWGMRSLLMVWAPVTCLLFANASASWINDPAQFHFLVYYATLTAVFGGWMLALNPPRRRKANPNATPDIAEKPLDVTA